MRAVPVSSPPAPASLRILELDFLGIEVEARNLARQRRFVALHLDGDVPHTRVATSFENRRGLHLGAHVSAELRFDPGVLRRTPRRRRGVLELHALGFEVLAGDLRVDGELSWIADGPAGMSRHVAFLKLDLAELEAIDIGDQGCVEAILFDARDDPHVGITLGGSECRDTGRALQGEGACVGVDVDCAVGMHGERELHRNALFVQRRLPVEALFVEGAGDVGGRDVLAGDLRCRRGAVHVDHDPLALVDDLDGGIGIEAGLGCVRPEGADVHTPGLDVEIRAWIGFEPDRAVGRDACVAHLEVRAGAERRKLTGGFDVGGDGLLQRPVCPQGPHVFGFCPRDVECELEQLAFGVNAGVHRHVAEVAVERAPDRTRRADVCLPRAGGVSPAEPAYDDAIAHDVRGHSLGCPEERAAHVGQLHLEGGRIGDPAAAVHTPDLDARKPDAPRSAGFARTAGR